MQKFYFRSKFLRIRVSRETGVCPRNGCQGRQHQTTCHSHCLPVPLLSWHPGLPPLLFSFFSPCTYVCTYLITLKQVFLDANVCRFKCCSQMLEKTNMLYCWCMYIYVRTCPGVESTGRQVHSPSLMSGTGMQGKTVLSAEDLSTDSYC